MNARARALGLLVAHRLVVYLGGLLVIAALSLASRTGVAVPVEARTAVVVVALGLMVLTYVGERRFQGREGGIDTVGNGRATYSWRTRFAAVMTILGIAAGIYVLLAVDLALGLLFVAGALLFARVAFGGEEVEA
ncbi:hypothetical protein [Halomarina litorea]|uniref:hypothetical protein n=1 Tax=Halomarina litorea TaxID=2961595 RepID=UPI0020C3C35F|nr:hypothetical protein [Halomarina sp. BCD28]